MVLADEGGGHWVLGSAWLLALLAEITYFLGFISTLGSQWILCRTDVSFPPLMLKTHQVDLLSSSLRFLSPQHRKLGQEIKSDKELDHNTLVVPLGIVLSAAPVTSISRALPYPETQKFKP